MQTDLNNLYTGDQISSHYVYAQNYTYLFCVLMYSTGLPLLYPFAAIFYFVLYWVYKGLLIKYYEKTTRFNEELPLYTTQWIKLGLIFHGIVGGLMMTNSELMPALDAFDVNLNLIQIEGLDNIEIDTDSQYGNIIARLASRPYSALYLVFWVFVIVFFIAKGTVLKLIWTVFGCILSRLFPDNKEEKPEAHSDDFFKEILFKPLMELYDKTQDELRDFEGVDLAKVEQFRYEEEVKLDVAAHKTKLVNRIEQIESVVDDHIKALFDGNIQEIAKNTAHLENCNAKINYLFERQNEFKFSDGQSRLRMQTITQSYSMLDSKQFKRIKPLQEILEDVKYNYTLG